MAIGLIFATHTFGVFLFAYAYELYDMAKALRLTIIIALISVAAIFIFILVLAFLAKGKASAEAIAEILGDGNDDRVLGTLGSAFEEGGGTTITARRERPEGTPVPYEIHCPNCGELFSPAPPKATCPWCGQAALAGA